MLRKWADAKHGIRIYSFSHPFGITLDVSKVGTHLDGGFWFSTFLFNFTTTLGSLCLCQTTVRTHYHPLGSLEQSLEMDAPSISVLVTR